MEDTLKAGHYENRRESVDIMIRSSRPVINELIGYGVDFARKADGSLDYTREGCHSRPRILFHEDITGKEITSHLLAAVRQLPNVTIRDFTTMVDIVTDGNRCLGIIARDSQGQYRAIQADETILASGGVGGLYDHSTNFPHLTGDALAIAMRHGVELEHIDYVQIHPTSLYSKKPGRSFLISESVRGEGAKLRGKDGQRFANEVLPRDLMTAEIRKQMKKDDRPFVWLDMTVLGEDVIKHHSHISMNVAWKTASMRRKTGSRSRRPSTTSWAASTSTSTARRRWTTSMPSAKRAATASTAATAWPAILSWKAWSLASAQPSISSKVISSRSRLSVPPTLPKPVRRQKPSSAVMKIHWLKNTAVMS